MSTMPTLAALPALPLAGVVAARCTKVEVGHVTTLTARRVEG